MSDLSGWCFAVVGRVPHEKCRAAACSCPCHDARSHSHDDEQLTLGGN